jgi:hypothetical protein
LATNSNEIFNETAGEIEEESATDAESDVDVVLQQAATLASDEQVFVNINIFVHS